MILTLTLNPAADKTLVLPSMERGEVNRVKESHLDPGGKGINVSRMLQRMGHPTMAFGFLGGEIGRLVERALRDEGLQYRFFYVPGQTRLNVIILETADSVTTNFNTPGPDVPGESLEALLGELERWMPACKVLVLAGSIPPGVPRDIYAMLIERAHWRGVRTVLDADGEALSLGLRAGPSMIKPNQTEAEDLLGRALPTLDAVVQGALELNRRGIPYVVISMGGRGAVIAWEGQVWQAVPPTVDRKSTVGSGDSMVAGVAAALADGGDVAEGLRTGTAAGAATALSSGTALGLMEDVRALLPRVQLRRLI